MRFHDTVLFSVLLVSGCAAPEGPPLRPVDELEALAARTDRVFTPSPAPESRTPADWFPTTPEVRFDDGLDLADANTLALFYAPEIVEARTGARIREALLLQAGRLGNPTLFAGPRLSATDSTWIVPLSLSQPIPMGGRLAAEEDRARAELESARAHVARVEAETLAEIRREFIRGAALRLEIETLAARVIDAVRVVDWVDRRVGAGESDALSAFTARAALEDTRFELRARETELAVVDRRLKTRIGLLSDAPVALSLDDRVFTVPEPPASSPDDRLSLPRLRVREAEYRAAEAGLREQLAGRWPEIAIGPEFESVAGDASVGAGLSLELPLFDRNEGNVLAARERFVGAREAYQRELLDAGRDEADARAALAAELQRLAELGEMQASAAAARGAMEARFERGEVDLLQVVVAADGLARFERRRIATAARVAIARIDVFLTSGFLGMATPVSPDGDSP